jgi:hypothetical protein
MVVRFYEILLLKNALYAKYPVAITATEPEPASHHTLMSSFITEASTTPANINFEISSKY